MALVAVLAALSACGDDQTEPPISEPFAMRRLTEDTYQDSDALFLRDGQAIL